MNRKRPQLPDLGDAELEVLTILWDHGPLPVREVMNHLHAAGRAVAYTTVLTFLSRLETKKCVAADKSGIAYVYRPLIARESIVHSRLHALIAQLFDGSACPLVLQLMQSESFTQEEIAQLQAHIDALDATAHSRKKEQDA
ncbi:MAG: BlaI/MecI/CopY family transcriptional regulator [Phycisphaerales bacterium]